MARNVRLRELLVGIEGLALVEVVTKRRAFDSIPDATRAAYVGLPAVLIWVAEKHELHPSAVERDAAS